MAVSAEQLNIILSARDKEFSKAMERNQKRVERFASKSQKSLGKTALSFGNLSKAAMRFLPALSSAALIASVKQVTSSLDEIGKKADQIGLTTDALQELRSIAESAGVAQSKLDSSMERFSKRLGEAQMGMGAAKNALEELNLSASDLTSMPLDDALTIVAEKMSQIESPTRQAALAAGLFGREGVAMINMMRDGADGMNAMRQQARDLGIVIDEDLIRNAEEAQTQLDLMSRVISANLSSALIEMAPLLVSTATGLARVSAGANDIFSQIQDIRENGLAATAKTNNYIDQVLDAARANGKLGEEIAAVEAAQMAIAGFTPSGTGEIELPDRTQLLADLAILEAALGDPMGADAANEAAAAFQRILDQSTLGLVAAQNQNEALEEQNRLRNIGAEAAERERIATEKTLLMSKITSPFSGDSFSVEATNARLEAERLGDEYEKAAIAASLILNPIQSAGAATARAGAAASDATANYDKLFAAIGANGKKIDTIMQGVESSMESAFMSMVDGTQTASEAFKGMASEIIKELYRIFVVKQITGLITSFASSAIGGAPQGPTMSGAPLSRFSNVSVPGLAAGGSVQAGKPYMTGEHGRELFVPQVNGRILSAGQTSGAMSAGGQGVTVIQNNTFGSGVSRAEVNAMLPKMVEATKAAVVDAKLRGGSYGRSFA